MLFYNLKTRNHVTVPDEHVKRITWLRRPNDRRYAFTETLTGEGCMKFVTKKDWEASSAPSMRLDSVMGAGLTALGE